MVAEKVPATSDTVPIIGEHLTVRSEKNNRSGIALLSLSLGIYLTIVMSLTVSYSLRVRVLRHSLLVNLCNYGCDRRQSLSASRHVHDRKASSSPMVD